MKGFIFMQTLVSLFLCNHSSKLNLTMVRKSPVNDFVVGLISFLTAWILDTVNMVLLYYFFSLDSKWLYTLHARKKICEVNCFWYFFKKNWFHFDVFQEEFISLSSAGKPVSVDLEGQQVKNLPSLWTMLMLHGDTYTASSQSLFHQSLIH